MLLRMLLRLLILFAAAGMGEAMIEILSGDPVNEAAQWILWLGIAIVLALWEPISPPRGHHHR